jgi:osmotically-inducible protein OsmY
MNSDARRSDQEIAQDVSRQLHADRRIAADEISVEVENGIVTLSGTVSSWGFSVLARQVASRVRDVLDIMNLVEVKVPDAAVRSDAELAAAVRHALVWNVFVPESAVQSTVIDGTVTLRGCVEEARQREEAELSVRHLAGVSRVCNLIEVKPSEDTAYDVALAIEEALERYAYGLARNVRIHVEQGLAMLSGAVDCAAEKDVILSAAGRVTGVSRVEDHLRIEGR